MSRMFSIPGYIIEELIHENKRLRVYRGHTVQERLPVIIKALKAETATSVDISKLIHEYEITRNLDSEGIVKPAHLEREGTVPALIMEDTEAVSLRQFLRTNSLDLSTFFSIAVQLAQSLGRIHQKLVIHGDLKPDNILIHPDTGIVRIIDFSSAMLVPGENQNAVFPKFLNQTAGTPEYMPPEQTGRTRYTMDQRGDLYSLGVVFYELLTGQLPFQADQPIEWVHAHLAQTPLPPDTVNSAVPLAVSAIVMKLLAKSPADRYQQAPSLLADLAECRRQWSKTGTIDLFSPGQADLSGRFRLSPKLYGREKESKALKAALATARAGKFNIVLVTGPAGSGKTALIQETVTPLVADTGYFIAGKFEQFRLNKPYAPFGQAFGQLMRQLLLESPDSLAAWKNRIRRALGRSGAVITGIIPEIELIIGHQPPVEALQPLEAQNRFRLIFQNFVRVFAKKEHPLIIFLDDLQWADPASLQLIRILSEDTEGLHLLLIGAYRDNEVEGSHPLRSTLAELDTKVPLLNIPLESLAAADTCQFIADSLSCAREQAQSLAEILYRKTGGNPFFLRQLLKMVHDEKFLIYNGTTGCWEWDQSSMHKLPMADDVVSLMLEKLRRLPEDTLNFLKLAAFIGNPFDMGTLATASGKTLPETADALRAALLEGLIMPAAKPGPAHRASGEGESAACAETHADTSWIDPIAFSSDDSTAASTAFFGDDPTVSFSFLHDRVQQAAYAMVPVEEEKKFHLKIGRLLLPSTGQDENDEKLFAVMDHFNRSLDMIDNPAERTKLAEYNLMAGRKAKTATAYDSALSHFQAGMALLPDNAWDERYGLTYDLHLECFQGEYLGGNFLTAEQLFEVLLARAKDKLAVASIYRVKIQLDSSMGRYTEAVRVGMKALSYLGAGLPVKAGKAAFMKEILLIKWYLRQKKIEDLVNWPAMSDQLQKNILELLTVLAAALNPVDPELYALCILKAGNQSVKYGNTDFSPIGYIGFSIVMGSGLGDYGTGHEFEQAAVKLVEKCHNSSARCIVNYVIGAYVTHWTQHGKRSVDYLNRAVQDGLEAGESLFIGHALSRSLETKCFLGVPLPEIFEECLSLRSLAGRIKHRSLWIYTILFQRFVASLMGQSENFPDFDQTEYDEDSFQKVSNTTLAAFYLSQIQLAYLFGDYVKSLAIADKAEKVMHGHAKKGQINAADYYFYHSLAITAAYDALPPERKRHYRQTLKKNQVRMKKWSKYCPGNFLHRYLLVEAEMARIAGRHLKAMSLWDEAIQSAQENGYVQNEALAGELAAKYYLAQGRPKISRTYMSEAWSAYMRWGARAKAKVLQESYPGLLNGLNSAEEKNISAEMFKQDFRNYLGNDSDPTGNPDLSTIRKVVQTLTEASNPETLLKAFLTMAMENAGADRGFLILEQAGELFIEAAQESLPSPAKLVTPVLVEKSSHLSRAVVRYVARTLETVVINEIQQAGIFARDPYFAKSRAQSIVCLPVLFRGIPAGVLYLENTVMSGVFVPERLDVLKLLSTQMAYVKKLETFLGIDARKFKHEAQSLPVSLTERELEVLQLIAAGLSNKEIARRLTITLSTVKTHVLNIYGKLQVNRRVQAVTRAKELKLLKD